MRLCRLRRITAAITVILTGRKVLRFSHPPSACPLPKPPPALYISRTPRLPPDRKPDLSSILDARGL